MLAVIAPPLPGIEWTPTSLQVLDPEFSYERFEEIVRMTGIGGDAVRWWLGDILVYGEMRFPQTYAQAIEGARVTERTLSRYRYVCQQIPAGRRRPNLSFSHHAEVASLDPDQQDILLSRAETEDWSSGEIRERAQDGRRLDRAAKPRQEILGAAPIVGAVAGLDTIRDALGTAYQHLRDPEKMDALQAAESIGPALRALDEATSTVTEAAKVTDLRDSVKAMLSHAAPGPRSGQGFWEVPKRLLDDVATMVGEDLDGE